MRRRSFNFTTKNQHGASERHIHFHPACVAGAGGRSGEDDASTPFLPCLVRAHVLEISPFALTTPAPGTQATPI